jgi:transposase-like protein
MMVAAVRRGEGIPAVARRFAVSPAVVSKWVSRARGCRLDRVNFSDQPRGPRTPWNRTAATTERAILQLRQRLRHDSVLGECGAKAIHAELGAAGIAVPSLATINRVLKRHGA